MSLNSIYELYNGACDMFVRPQRLIYDESALGPKTFKFGSTNFIREDLKLTNERGLTLECSHFYNKSFVNSFSFNDLPTYSIKKLREICKKENINISDCVEKKEIIDTIKENIKEEEKEENEENQSAPCIIYLHGNCGCRMDSIDCLELILSYGLSLFAVDLSGSGLSEGEYISLGYYEQDDVSTIIQYLQKCSFVSKIGLWGRSMGAATSILYTSKQLSDISLMILDSPFSSLASLSKEVVSQFELGIPEWIISTSFPIVMKMIRRTVAQKANFDLYDVSPIDKVDLCNIPAFFIHGSDDNFVSPKHSLSLFEKYIDPHNRKEILLVSGDHNTPRPVEAINSVSLFIYRYLISNEVKLSNHKQALKVFGNTSTTKDIDCFYGKQVKGLDPHSQWPYNIVIGISNDGVQLILPYTELVTHYFPFMSIAHAFVKDEFFFAMQIPGHISNENENLHGLLVFYCIDAKKLFETLQQKSKKEPITVNL